MTGTSKRPFVEAQEEDVVDDLVVAAQFAMAQPVLAKPPNDDNEIDLLSVDEGSTSSTDNDNPVGSLQRKEKEEHADESDVEEDQTTHGIALAKLLDGLDSDGVDEDDEEEDSDHDADNIKIPKEKQKPLSKNEVDAYDATLHDLQKRLNWNLEISNVKLPVHPSSWAIAGHVQQHVVAERTIVILSPAGGTLLEAGTLLALLLKTDVTIDGLRLPRQIPLGRILEVFGPVSRPLYSLRLTCLHEPSTASLGKNNDDLSNGDSLRDPWGKEGLFTKYVKQNPHLPVHYIPNGSDATTKILNTARIYETNGRGCDASNRYDEEIDQSEMDYSDDEQERRAKQGRKESRRLASRTGVASSPIVMPTGFHHPSQSSNPSFQRNRHFNSQSLPGWMPAVSTSNDLRPNPPMDNIGDESDTEYYDFS